MGLFNKKKKATPKKNDYRAKILEIRPLSEEYVPGFKYDYEYRVHGSPYQFGEGVTGGEIMCRLLNGKKEGYVKAATRKGKDWDGNPALSVYAIDDNGVKWKVGFVAQYDKVDRYEKLLKMIAQSKSNLYLEMKRDGEPEFTRGWLHVAFNE